MLKLVTMNKNGADCPMVQFITSWTGISCVLCCGLTLANGLSSNVTCSVHGHLQSF